MRRRASGGGGGEAVRCGALLLSAGLLCAVGCAGAGTGGARPAEASDGTEFDIGRADYDWTIRALDGETVDVARYRGRVLFINVWASWCTPCIAEMAGIERLYRSLRGSGVEFLIVSPEASEPVRRFVRTYGYDLPVYLEVDRMPDRFGLDALPTTFVVDTAGMIVLRRRGAAEWDRPSVRRLLLSLVE